MENHGPDYQPKMYIDQSMRMIVISWLVEVACEYELHQETLFLAAALLDRFMSVAKVGNAFLCAIRHAIAITIVDSHLQSVADSVHASQSCRRLKYY